MSRKILTILCLTGILLLPAQYAVSQNQRDPHFEKIDFAHGLFQRGLFDMAASEYQQFMKNFPNNPHTHEAYFGLAESYFFSKKYPEAVLVYEKYMALFSNRDKISMVRLRLGQCLLNEKEYDRALTSISGIKDEGIEEKWQQKKYFLLAEVHQAMGNNDQAIESLQKVEQISSSSPTAMEAYIKLGEAFKLKEDFPAAAENLEKVVNQTDDPKIKSLALYKLAEVTFLSQEYDLSADQFAMVVDLKQDAKMVEDAIANLLLALFNVPAYNAVISRFSHYQESLTEQGRLFDALYILARSYKQLDKYNEALKTVNQALAIKKLKEKDRNKIIDVQVETLFLAKNYEAVIDLITKTLIKDMTYRQKALFFLAESHYSTGKFKKAHDRYIQLLQEYPETSYKQEANYGLAHAKNALGFEQEAAALFAEYFSTADDDEKKKEALYNQILLKSKLEKNDEAIADASQYLKDYPDDAKKGTIMFLLGSLYSRQKQHQESIEIFQQIVDGDPTNAKRQDSLFLLAYNLQLSGNKAKALDYYQQVSLNPEDPGLYYSAKKNMALLYLEEEDFSKAVLLLKEIISSYPENDLTVDMYLWLAEKSLEAKAYDTVIDILKKADPKKKSPDDQQAIAYFKGMAYQRQNDFQRALQYYDLALSAETESVYVVQAQLGKTQCLVAQQKYDEAKEILDKVLLNFGDDQTVSLKARFEMGNLLELQQKYEQASKFYMLVAVLYSDAYYCPESLFRAGQIFEKINKSQEAMNVYQEIIQLYTGSHRFAEAQKRLAAISQ